MDTIGRQRIASVMRVWILAMFAIIGCGNVGRSGDGTGIGVSKESAPAMQPKVGQSGAEGGCGFMADGPPNMPFDFRVPRYGFSGADVADAVRGSHEIVVAWQPWFEAPSSPAAKRALLLEITPQQKARIVQCGWIEVIADVRLRDKSSGIEVTFTGKLTAFGSADADPHISEVSLSESFDSAELAAELGLPPAADAGGQADGFKLYADFMSGRWTAALDAVRGDISCQLLGTPSTNPCAGDYASLIGVQEPERVALSAPFGAHHQIRDLVAAVSGLPALRVRWSDASTTALTIEVTPRDFACTGQRPLIADSSELADSGAQKLIDVALAPLELHLTTQDGKLDAKLPASVHSAVDVGATWNGGAELDSALTPLSALTMTDWNAISDVPSSDLAFASLLLAVPLAENEGYAQFHVEAYRPYEGVPAYPMVFESSSNRIGCFSNGVPAKAFESALELPAK